MKSQRVIYFKFKVNVFLYHITGNKKVKTLCFKKIISSPTMYNYEGVFILYIHHAGRLNCYSNIRTFYAKLLQIGSYKFYHAKENKMLSISPGGATFQTTSPLRTEAILFLQNFGSDLGPTHIFLLEKSVDQNRTRPGPDPKFQIFFEHLWDTGTYLQLSRLWGITRYTNKSLNG